MKFKDKVSGTVIEFFNEYDIASTLTNPAYEAVEEAPEPSVVSKKAPSKKQVEE